MNLVYFSASAKKKARIHFWDEVKFFIVNQKRGLEGTSMQLNIRAIWASSKL